MIHFDALGQTAHIATLLDIKWLLHYSKLNFSPHNVFADYIGAIFRDFASRLHGKSSNPKHIELLKSSKWAINRREYHSMAIPEQGDTLTLQSRYGRRADRFSALHVVLRSSYVCSKVAIIDSSWFLPTKVFFFSLNRFSPQASEARNAFMRHFTRQDCA